MTLLQAISKNCNDEVPRPGKAAIGYEIIGNILTVPLAEPAVADAAPGVVGE